MPGPAPDLCTGDFRSKNSVNSMVRPRYAGLQPGVTKRTGTAACKKALVMLRHCYARLQLEVAKCIVTAAGMICFEVAALALCGS